MKYRDLNILLTQGDKEYAEANWEQFSAVIGVGGEKATGIGLEYHMHRPVKDEDSPSPADIACWVSYALQRMGDNKRVLVHCAAGQNRSLIIGTLILSFFENRFYGDIVKEIHYKCLMESPPHDWWPYQHWADAISNWVNLQIEQKSFAHKPFATHLMAVSLEEALALVNNPRKDYLSSLYKYASRLPTPARVVEVGTYKGDSTLMLAAALKGTDSVIISIDPIFQWSGVIVADAHLKYPGYYESSLIEILNRLSTCGLEGYVSIIPSYSSHVLERWDGRTISMLFVDGEHTYDSVFKNCGWMEYVRSGGIACFDDWFFEVSNAVRDYISIHPEWKIIHESTDAETDDYCVTLLQKQ